MTASSRLLVLLLALAAVAPALANVEISPGEAGQIGRRVWQNECGGTVSGLVSWNEGEAFASLGIGHFIWYPRGRRGPFEESFPPLLKFMAQRGSTLPAFLRSGDEPCPWNSRADFQRATDSTPMRELRQFLARTIDLQGAFLVERLRSSLAKMLTQTTDREHVQRQFDRVAASASGCYALVDYVNFKGEGTLASERYRGEGWGLLQVLGNMRGDQSALDEFAASAKTVLRRRVANSPPARGEARWLRGWLARVETYEK